MRADGLSQAEERLERAFAAFAEFETANRNWSFVPAEAAWKDFLVAISGLYTKLEQGSFGQGSSSNWFGQIKSVRKTDQLLRYLQHARNSDEHTLRLSAEASEEITATSAHPEVRVEGSTIFAPASLPPGTPLVNLHQPGLRLLPVIDRGVTYDTAKEHLGRFIEGRLPLLVGQAALDYVKGLVREASTFVNLD